MEKRKAREGGERNRGWEECWTKAVPTWGRLEAIQLSLDRKELPTDTKAHRLEGVHSTCHLQVSEFRTSY